VLCDGCADDLIGASQIVPQQIEMRAANTTAAALVDAWGYPHHVAPAMSIGRASEHELVILDATVSRSHAELRFVHGQWRLRDDGSTCGTYVDDEQIIGETVLGDGERVRFGDVAFFFVLDVPRLPPMPAREDAGTVKTVPVPITRRMQPLPKGTLHIQLRAPSGGGGGFVVIEGKSIQLTTAQYELVEILVARRLGDTEKPEAERGFVHAQELMKLSLESTEPTEDHVRQLVRRVRRALDKADLGDLIEARRGVGYRLRVVPHG
jgi:pSer/pThr/pTyr-binding forkhead associated (FHA) protein